MPQKGTGQEASSLRHLGIGTFVLPKSSVHGPSSSLAAAVSDLPKSTLFRLRTESRSAQSGLEPYCKTSKIRSTALGCSLRTPKFVNHFLPWKLISSDFFHFRKVKRFSNKILNQQCLVRILTSHLSVSLAVGSLGVQRQNTPCFSSSKLQPFHCKREEEFNSMELSFWCLMLNEKENFAGTGVTQSDCTKSEAKPNCGKNSD